MYRSRIPRIIPLQNLSLSTRGDVEKQDEAYHALLGNPPAPRVCADDLAEQHLLRTQNGPL